MGDVIAIHKEQLDPNYEEYSKELYFGGLDKPYGRAVKDKDHLDFIAINLIGHGCILMVKDVSSFTNLMKYKNNCFIKRHVPEKF